MSAPSATGKLDSLLAWATPGRRTVYGAMIAAGYAVVLLIFVLMAQRQAAQGDTPTITDFNTFYAVSLLLDDHPAAATYDPTAMRAAELTAARRAYPDASAEQFAQLPTFLWLYPPTATLLVAPLDRLPYGLAYLLWDALTLGLWLSAMARILPGRSAVAVALALPATFVNAAFGQMGFLVAGLTGWGLILLRRRPALAGVAIGLLTIKPHFGPLLALALLVGGHWRAIASASLTALALAAASLLAFGAGPWQALLDHGLGGGQLLESGGVPWSLMPTLYPGLRLLGAGNGLATALQAVTAAACAAAVAWAWRRSRQTGEQGAEEEAGLAAALLCTATLLALPFAYAYDLPLAALPVFWLARAGFRNGAELAVAVAAGLLGFLAPGLAKLGVPAGPLVLAALLVVLIRRFNAAAVSRCRSAAPCSPTAGRRLPDRP